MLSFTEENYLKALLKLAWEGDGSEEAGTNDIARELNVKPATANDMLKKLKEKKLVSYKRYGKSSLTAAGRRLGIEIVRKHRLWETFLFEKLGFSWDEVHEVAEQLEHIKSAKLVNKLDQFLGYPAVDPHGDAIPNAKGEINLQQRKTLAEQAVGMRCTVAGVKDNTAAFLQYVDKVGLAINQQLTVTSVQPYDGLIEIEVDGKRSSVSPQFAENIIVQPLVNKAAGGRSKK